MIEIPSPFESNSVIGHGLAKDSIMAAYDSGRMHHAWLITGQEGIGKTTLAIHMAHMLLSQGENRFSKFTAAHPTARLIAAQSHPDFLTIACPIDEKTGIPKKEIPVKEARKITPFLRLTASHGSGRVALIDGAHKLNQNAQNALLKIIEEPSVGSIIIMTATTSAALLPTIRSRCQALALSSLEPIDLDTILMRMGAELPEAQEDKDRLLSFAGGSVGAALKLMQTDGLEIYDELITLLADLLDMNIPRLHEVAGLISKKSDLQSFEVTSELLIRLLENAARMAAAGQVDEAGLAPKLGGRAHLDKLLDLCENIKKTLASAQISNLDQKLVFIDAMNEIKRCARS